MVDPDLKWHQVDISIAFTSFILQATELEYGTCWIGAFNEGMVKDILNIPDDKKVLVCMAFGLPKGDFVPKPRKEIKSFIFTDKYGQPF